MMLSKVSEANEYDEAINTNTNARVVKQAIEGLLIAALTALARNDGFQVLLEESNIPKLGEKGLAEKRVDGVLGLSSLALLPVYRPPDW